MQRSNTILLGAILALYAAPAWAAEPVVGAELGALGGAAAAASDRNAAITVNPGLIALHDRYDLSGQFTYGPSALSRWGVSAVDTRTSRWLALGLQYVGDRSEPPLQPADLPGWTVAGKEPSNVKRHHDFTLAAAVEGWDRKLSFGVSGTFSIYSHDRQGSGSTGNVDAGLGARPTEWLDLGVAGRNLIPLDDIGDLELAVVGGARVHGDPGALIVDVEWRETNGMPITVAGGGELPLGKVVAGRVGYRFEGPADIHRVTGGFGFSGQGGSFDLGAQVPVGPGQPTFDGTVLLVSLHVAAPTVDEPVGF